MCLKPWYVLRFYIILRDTSHPVATHTVSTRYNGAFNWHLRKRERETQHKRCSMWMDIFFPAIANWIGCIYICVLCKRVAPLSHSPAKSDVWTLPSRKHIKRVPYIQPSKCCLVHSTGQWTAYIDRNSPHVYAYTLLLCAFYVCEWVSRELLVNHPCVSLRFVLFCGRLWHSGYGTDRTVVVNSGRSSSTSNTQFRYVLLCAHLWCVLQIG